MNSKQIANPKVEVPKGMTLNDKDYLNDTLSCLKNIVKNYAIVLTEASNEHLYNHYKQMFDNFISLQREVYELMFRYGWYQLEQVDDDKKQQKYTTLQQEFTEINGSK